MRWQKKSLLEARDKILTQTEEIKAMYADLRQANTQIVALEISRSSSSVNETMRSIEERFTEHINETQRMLHKVVGYSGAGVVLATALIVYFIKKVDGLRSILLTHVSQMLVPKFPFKCTVLAK